MSELLSGIENSSTDGLALFAGVAQLVAHQPSKPTVAGSSPSACSIFDSAVKSAVSAGVPEKQCPPRLAGEMLAIADMFGHPPKLQSGLVPDFF